MPLRAYLRFAATDWRFVAFGFTMSFASSFGQTHFVAVFGPSLQAELDLSHTAWGTIYMLGTLASAALLPWSGKLIDRFDLRHYATAVALALALACVLAASVTAVWMLPLAIFALRQTGQGLSSHASATSMARYFDDGRGRAIAIAALGYAAGEALFPFLAVLGIARFGWRFTYLGAGGVQLLVFLPLIAWLLRGHGVRHGDYLARLARAGSDPAGAVLSWSRARVLRDVRFYLLLPGVVAPSMVLTAMFFHHLNVADAKGWSHAWITGSYSVYAVSSVAFSLTTGPLIDRLGAARLVPWMLLPMMAGLVVLAALDARWVVFPYMALIGLTAAVGYTAVNALWAELYGVGHLGAIRSLAFALSVFASALGPVSMGALMDLGIPVGAILLGYCGYAAAASALMRIAVARPAAGSAGSAGVGPT